MKNKFIKVGFLALLLYAGSSMSTTFHDRGDTGLYLMVYIPTFSLLMYVSYLAISELDRRKK
jgi:hypothetical protein